VNSPTESSETALIRARHAVRTDHLLGIDQVLLHSDPPDVQHPEVEIIRQAAPTSSPDREAVNRAEPVITPPDGDTPEERLESLRRQHDAGCPHCTTATGHQNTVFGEGSATADLMFIGEAPGAEEDQTGRPFVGPAGKKLEEMILAMGFKRHDVYIANVLKSRPPKNRTPLEHEIEACSPYLAEQVRIIKPRVIVTLGGPASKLLLESPKGITHLRGIWGAYQAGDETYPVMPTFHPAYLLRNYTQETRSQVWNDLQAAMARLD
jgi:DNA polymerase